MVDVDHRIHSHQAHVAGLKRLSARAHAGPNTPCSAGRKVCFSFAAYARNVIEHLRGCSVVIERGLTDEEFARIEAAFGLTFPPDLRAILQEGLPVGKGFPDWRRESSHRLQVRLDLPIAGLLSEVARGKLWWKQWGARPANAEHSVRVAVAALKKAPILVPVYNHCYLPSFPTLAGNPVLFVYQMDCFISGYDIADFFQRQNFLPLDFDVPDMLPDLTDWTDDSGRIARLASGRDFARERERLVPRGSHVLHDSAQVRNYDETSLWRSKSEAEEAVTQWDGLDREIESWGRSLDSLVSKHPEVFLKSVDNSGKRSTTKAYESNSFRAGSSPRSRELHRAADQDVISKFYFFEERPLSSQTLNHFTVTAPHWAAKVVRRIEFWSELMEKRQLVSVAASEILFSAHKVDVDLANFTSDWDDQAVKEFQNTFLPKWLAIYLEDLALRLREGGWKDDDIVEMMEASCEHHLDVAVDKQSVLDELSRQAELLSGSLRMAGWSVRDVADVLSLDFPFGGHRRTPSKMSPELAARLTTFADYVVNA